MGTAVRPDKAEEAAKLFKKAEKYWAPSLLDLRLKPDWEAAAPLYEKSALAFKQSGQLEKARTAYEKAAQSQEKIGSPWHAAKHLETCMALSKELGALPQVAEYSCQAANLYVEAGRASAGAEALARGAKLLEDGAPGDAAELYADALELYESDGKGGQAGDTYRAAVALLLKGARWSDAVATLLRFGESCDAAGARSSQAKAYLGAICVWLYANDAQQAWQVYQDVLAIPAFASSDEAFAADALFTAYTGGAERVRACVQSKAAFKQMDAHLARLSQKLPTGDAAKMGAQIAGLMGSGTAGGAGEDEDEDLT